MLGKLPQFTKEFKVQATNCMVLARGLGTEFFGLKEEDDVGHRLTAKRFYIYTRDFLLALSDLTNAAIGIVGKCTLDRQFIEESFWAAIDSDDQEGDAANNFCEMLLEPLNKPKFCILRNYQIALALEIDEFRLGPVRVVRGEKLAAEVNARYSNNFLHVQVRDQPVESEGDDRSILLLSPVCWEVEVKASAGKVHREAVWLANVAISLLRALYPVDKATGLFPYYGEEEPATDVRPIFSKNSLVYSDSKVSFGGWAMPHHYDITQEVLAVLNDEKSQLAAKAIFFPAPMSLASHIYRGLGWLARARQSEDLSERYLHTFTALETLLTNDDKSMPITDTIARHASAIWTNANEARRDVAQTIKRSYGIRSSLVHGGIRNISASDAMVMQKICEVIYRLIIHTADLSVPFADFDASLRLASYGLPWNCPKPPQT